MKTVGWDLWITNDWHYIVLIKALTQFSEIKLGKGEIIVSLKLLAEQ